MASEASVIREAIDVADGVSWIVYAAIMASVRTEFFKTNRTTFLTDRYYPTMAV